MDSPEITPSHCVTFSGITRRKKNKVARPSANTLIVWVSVTIAPRKAACLRVPRDPTRYAATMVLPCPGVSAWAPPRTNAAARPTRIIHGVISRSCNNLDKKSPRVTVPGGAAAAVMVAGEGAAGGRFGWGVGGGWGGGVS